MKKIAILQSNYIPWKGYFDIIRSVDEFILYDDMQYTRRDWRNRNKIKTPQGLLWLTIPVDTKGKYLQKINETKVTGHDWVSAHRKALEVNYARAPYYHYYIDAVDEMYRACEKEDYLSPVNEIFLHGICKLLKIETKITHSSDYSMLEGKTERLVGLVKSAGGSFYLSGPAAKDYIVDQYFEEAGIRLSYMDYSGYPEYPQLYGAFEHGVSILDLLFCTGPDAVTYMLPESRIHPSL